MNGMRRKYENVRNAKRKCEKCEKCESVKNVKINKYENIMNDCILYKAACG